MGLLPIYFALLMQDQKAINILLGAGDEINDRTKTGECITHLALLKGKTNLLKTLVKKYNADVNCKNNTNTTPLQIACVKSNIEAIEFLLLKGSNPNIKAKGQNNPTPLKTAVVQINPTIVSLLLRYGAKIDSKDIFNELKIAIKLQEAKITQTERNKLKKIIMDLKRSSEEIQAN